MYYLQSRYYDPAICRFINADSFASTGQEIIGTNMYAYCGNNPVSRIDESGSAWLTTLGIGVLVTGISGLASGISSVISGGDFWAGFAAGAIAGVVGYGLARVNFYAEERTRTMKCGMEERRRRRLDGAEPLSAQSADANEFLSAY